MRESTIHSSKVSKERMRGNSFAIASKCGSLIANTQVSSQSPITKISIFRGIGDCTISNLPKHPSVQQFSNTKLLCYRKQK